MNTTPTSKKEIVHSPAEMKLVQSLIDNGALPRNIEKIVSEKYAARLKEFAATAKAINDGSVEG